MPATTPRSQPSAPAQARSRLAFTLLEVLLVVAIIGLLTGLVGGVGPAVFNRARSARTRVELQVLAGALESYRLAHGDFPRTQNPAELLQYLAGRRGPGYVPISAAPHLDLQRLRISGNPWTDETATVLDAWGSRYRYAYQSLTPWTNPAPVLYSPGADAHAAESLLPGGYADTTAAENQDNLHADPLP